MAALQPGGVRSTQEAGETQPYQFIPLFSRSHFSHMFSLYSHGISGVVFTPTRRLQQTAVSCKRSNCNKKENFKEIVKVARLRFLLKDGKQRGFPVLS